MDIELFSPVESTEVFRAFFIEDPRPRIDVWEASIECFL